MLILKSPSQDAGTAMSIVAYWILLVLLATLVASVVLLAVAVLPDFIGGLLMLWNAVRQFSLRTMLIFMTVASVGFCAVKRVGTNALFAATPDLFFLCLGVAATILILLLVHDIWIVLGIHRRRSTYWRIQQRFYRCRTNHDEKFKSMAACTPSRQTCVARPRSTISRR